MTIKKLSILLFLSIIIFPLTSLADTAIFAGGCFWSMQHDFDKVNGVIDTTVGYTGGSVANPSYEQVSTGTTGHYEAIKVEFDPDVISYAQLVDYFIHDIDPSDATGQFCDNGNEYHSAIFYSNDTQRKTALNSIVTLKNSKQFAAVYTLVLPAKPFYPAEDYHQKYAEKNPGAYGAYRSGCRRDETLKQVWAK